MIIGSNPFFNAAQFAQPTTIAQQVASLSSGYGGAVSRIPATMQQMMGSRQSAMGMEQMAMAQAYRQGAMQGSGMGGLAPGMMGGAGQSWEQVMAMAMAAERQKQMGITPGAADQAGGKKGKCKKGKKGKKGKDGADNQAVLQARAQGIAQGMGMAQAQQQQVQMQQQQAQQQQMQGMMLAGLLMS